MPEQPLTNAQELEVNSIRSRGGPETLEEFHLWTRSVYHSIVKAMDLEAAANLDAMDYYAAINRVERLGRLGLRFGNIELQKRCNVEHLPNVSELLPVVVDYLDWCRNELASPANENACTDSNNAQLAVTHEKAYQGFKLAEDHLARDGISPTDRTAYEWLEENSPPELKLPPYDTWARYVRYGRKYHEDRKNTPRAGRECRSAVDSDGASFDP